MAKLADLKSKKKAAVKEEASTTEAAAPATDAVVEEKPVKEKKKRERTTTDEELQALRLKNLKPKVKSPEKVAEEKEAKDRILAELETGPKTVAELYAAMYDPSEDKKEVSDIKKEIRKYCRALGCTREKVEGSVTKQYFKPE